VDQHVGLQWVILTRGDRPEALDRAIESLDAPVTVVQNGADAVASIDGASVISLADNVGVPGGRDIGARQTDSEIIGFLDDDAAASAGVSRAVTEAFAADERLGAVALRLVDENGETARRHVPRFGGRGADRGGEVALFLGGACAIRRDAYEDAGGYWTDLFYGHEEVELAWRLIDRGWTIRYLPQVSVFHPRTEIGRHAAGWTLTGRNRVLVARRTLPRPISSVHAMAWLLLGTLRAPGSENRRAYMQGWRSGWRRRIDRSPIRWVTVWRLTRLGRPPVL
jgi:GT2 family glycosyltransferase